jgi:hypothetical protein
VPLPAEARFYDPGEALDEDFTGHLGLSYAPIQENDGRLDDLKVALVNAVSQLYLESVALRFDAIEVETF